MQSFFSAYVTRLALLTGIVLLATCATRPAADEAPADTEQAVQTINVAGIQREYLLYRHDHNSAVDAIIIVLHGGGGNANRMRRVGFERVSDTLNPVIVYPKGIGGGWNDGRDGATVINRSQNADDIGFLRALQARLLLDYQLPASRSILTGVSNGGMMTLRMVCEGDIEFGAAITFIALLPVPLKEACLNAPAANLAIIVSSEDRLVPMNGGQVARFSGDRGRVLSLTETRSIFVQALGCDEATRRESGPVDKFPRDGTALLTETYSPCADGVSLEIVQIQGGGHRWPGVGPVLRPGQRGALSGISSREIDGASYVLDFFGRTQANASE